MSNGLLQSAKAYHNLNRGKELLVKVSGAELIDEAFEKLAAAIHTLVRDDIRIILAYGGGEQIDTAWKTQHTEPRPKRGGMGITTEEVLRHAVVPAAEQVRDQLQREFKSMHILAPEDIRCALLENYGLVGGGRRATRTCSH
jgi:acetylglutamate kinase